MRREPAAAVGLLVAGSGLLFLADAVDPAADAAAALALVAGAGAAATLAARGTLRRGIGGLLVLVGAVGVLVGLAAGAWSAVVGGAATGVAGGWVAWRGPSWSRLSSRYERTPAEAGSPHALWAALDRGEDPTDDRVDLPD